MFFMLATSAAENWMAEDVAPDALAMHPVFIVGAPRSGTSWIQRLLLCEPTICGGQETHFFSVFSQVLWSYDSHRKLGRNVGLPCYWDKQELLQQIRDLWQTTVMPVIQACPRAELLIEKTPDHATVLPEILQLLPRARVIHVVRDSRSVVASLLAANKDWGSAWAPGAARDAAILWYRYVRQAMTATEKMHPEQYIMVRYEDLMHDGLAQTKRLFDFLGIYKSTKDLEQFIEKQQFTRQKNDASLIPVVRGSPTEPAGFFRKGTVDSWRSDLSLCQKAIVWRYTHKLMHELGYNWYGRDFSGQASAG
jgi:Sulfotransferase family